MDMGLGFRVSGLNRFWIKRGAPFAPQEYMGTTMGSLNISHMGGLLTQLIFERGLELEFLALGFRDLA